VEDRFGGGEELEDLIWLEAKTRSASIDLEVQRNIQSATTQYLGLLLAVQGQPELWYVS
jgi:hypothetical protein